MTLKLSLGTIEIATHAIHTLFTLDSKPILSQAEKEARYALTAYLKEVDILNEEGNVIYQGLPTAIEKVIDEYM